ncbi:MAG: hypothetical protein U0Z26_14330 [Anaerolineales bacterium]
MKKLSYGKWTFLLVLITLACSTLTPKPKPSEEDIEKEEQAIYSFFVGSGTAPVVLLQETSTDMSADRQQQTLDYIKSGLNGISDETINNFLERNAQPSQLSTDMNLGVDYILMSTDELKQISSQPNWGELLTQKYPGTQGYTIFSRVGFNNSFDQAVIYVGNVAGPLMGYGSYYLMEKKNGEWLMIGEINVWIS